MPYRSFCSLYREWTLPSTRTTKFTSGEFCGPRIVRRRPRPNPPPPQPLRPPLPAQLQARQARAAAMSTAGTANTRKAYASSWCRRWNIWPFPGSAGRRTYIVPALSAWPSVAAATPALRDRACGFAIDLRKMLTDRRKDRSCIAVTSFTSAGFESVSPRQIMDKYRSDVRSPRRNAVAPSGVQNSHGDTSWSPVVSKSLRFRVARRPPFTRAIAAIIPSGADMPRPFRTAVPMISP